MDQRASRQLGIETALRGEHEIAEWLFTLPAFYAEFAPPPQYHDSVDHLSVLKDCGLLTARPVCVCLAVRGALVHLSEIS